MQSIYVLEIGPMVKVGRTLHPQLRLTGLRRRDPGHPKGRVVVFPGISHALSTERRCISALKGAAHVVPGRIEYFTGIDFDAASELVRRIVHSEPA